MAFPSEPQIRLLRFVAANPGTKLQDACKPLGRSYETVRRLAAGLRREHLLYPARPAWLILRPEHVPGRDYYKSGNGPGQGAIVVALMMSRSGTLQQTELLKSLKKRSPYSLTTLTEAVRTLRDTETLWPWDALVLMDLGEMNARWVGISVQPQRWRPA